MEDSADADHRSLRPARTNHARRWRSAHCTKLGAQQGAPQTDVESWCVRINTASRNAATCSGRQLPIVHQKSSMLHGRQMGLVGP